MWFYEEDLKWWEFCLGLKEVPNYNNWQHLITLLKCSPKATLSSTRHCGACLPLAWGKPGGCGAWEQLARCTVAVLCLSVCVPCGPLVLPPLCTPPSLWEVSASGSRWGPTLPYASECAQHTHVQSVMLLMRPNKWFLNMLWMRRTHERVLIISPSDSLLIPALKPVRSFYCSVFSQVECLSI